MKKNEKTKLVTVDYAGTLVELGGISGPIINPSKVGIETITRMINNQKKVYEVNPANHNETVRLSLKNINLVNFPEVTKPVNANVNPASVKSTAAKVADSSNTATAKVTTEEEKKQSSDFKKK